MPEVQPSPSPPATPLAAVLTASGGTPDDGIAGVKTSGGDGRADVTKCGGDSSVAGTKASSVSGGGGGGGGDGSKSGTKKREQSRSPEASPAGPADGKQGAGGAAATASADDDKGGDGDESESDWSVVSDTEVRGIRSLMQKHGEDWRSVLGVEADERLDMEIEAIKVQNDQLSGALPPSEDPAKKARSILSVMIAKASRKLPRAVHRQILDTFQVIILEPYHYPPVCKVTSYFYFLLSFRQEEPRVPCVGTRPPVVVVVDEW